MAALAFSAVRPLRKLADMRIGRMAVRTEVVLDRLFEVPALVTIYTRDLQMSSEKREGSL